jgi:hypothetical protein
MRHSSLLLTALFALGCSVTQSEDLETSGMGASITVSADGSGVSSVSARLSTDANALNSIQLDSGDIFLATAGTQSEDMSMLDVLDDISYQASFSGQDSAGTTYNVALNRRSGFVSAPSSTVTMPAPYNITTPTSSATFSRQSDDVTVTYDSSGTGDPVTWNISSTTCSSSPSGSVANDSGSFTIAKGSLVTTDAQEKNLTCQVTITLQRTRTGTIDSHYGYGGTINATQERSVTFTSTP